MPLRTLITLALSVTAISAATACLFNPPGPLRPPASSPVCQPPIDDTSPFFSPWSQAPYCLRIGPDHPNLTQSVYCVYTISSSSSSSSSSPPSFSHFPPNHPTSLIASPQQASSLIASVVPQPISSLFQRNLPLSGSQLTSTSPSSSSSLQPAYRVAPIPGKGLGLVATRQLKKGEVFMAEYPALLLDVNFLQEAKPHHRRRLVKRAVERLGEEERNRVWGLEGKRGGGKRDGGYLLDEVLGVNAVRVEMEEGSAEAMGLWVEFSRINHDCQPNALYRFSPKTLALEVFPYRTIQAGEEITVSYTPIIMPRDERRPYLQQIWGFNCSCALCRSTDAAATSDSDHRRQRVVELRQSVLQASSEGYFENALVMAREWLEVGEKEGIPPLMAEWYDVMARLSFDVGDLEGAKRYALLAMDAWGRFGSVDGTDLDAARGYVRELGRLGRDTRLERKGIRNMFGDV